MLSLARTWSVEKARSFIATSADTAIFCCKVFDVRKTICLPDRQAFGERRVEDGGGLSGTGRRLGDQVLALTDGRRDSLHQLLLDRSRRGVGEGEPTGGQGLALADLFLRLQMREKPCQAPLDVAISVSSPGATATETSSPVSMST